MPVSDPNRDRDETASEQRRVARGTAERVRRVHEQSRLAIAWSEELIEESRQLLARIRSRAAPGAGAPGDR